MADQQDPKQQPATLSPVEDHGLAKEDLVASLEFKPCHNDDDAAVSAVIASVVPQTTLSRNDRSLPGAFRILTTRQAQLAARNAANHNNGANGMGDSGDDEAESSFGEDATRAPEPPVMALDATMVATAVDGAAADGVMEVFKAVPIEPNQAPKWPRSVYWIIGTALLVSAVCLAIALSTMGRKSKTWSVATSSEETRHNDREVGNTNTNGTADVGIEEEVLDPKEAQRGAINDPFPLTPNKLFADYDRIRAHMAFISVQMPSSCRLLRHEPMPRHEEEMKIHVNCGTVGDDDYNATTTTDAILYVDEVLSLNVDRCEYDRGNHHRSATCVIGKNRQAFSFVVYSCGFRGDNAIVATTTSVALARQNATCADSQLRPFDVRDTQQTLLTGLALGHLCRDTIDGSLAYVSVPTDCRPDEDQPYLLSYETISTDACIVQQREDECINNHDCAIGSYGIRQQRPYNDDGIIGTTTAGRTTGRPLSCGAARWDKSIFGPSAMETTLAGIDAIVIANREFANVFAEDFGGER
jgi:hypothetical protein